MIATIVIVSLGLAWLGSETNWLTIRLPIGESLQDYDNRILAEFKRQQAEWDAKDEVEYQEWLKQRYEPVLVYGANIHSEVDRRDRWAVIEDALAKRRNNEEIYQRGVKCNQW